jgi:hypothetical protein
MWFATEGTNSNFQSEGEREQDGKALFISKKHLSNFKNNIYSNPKLIILILISKWYSI